MKLFTALPHLASSPPPPPLPSLATAAAQWPSGKAIVWTVGDGGSLLAVLSHQGLETGIVVAALPDTWRCRVSVRTHWPGVTHLGLDDIAAAGW